MRRSGILALVLAGLFAAHTAAADSYAFGFNPDTGDAWLDAHLGDINVYADGHLDGYIDQVCIQTGAPRYYIETLVIEERYPPADVWMIAQTAQVSGQPIETVRTHFDRNRGRGWGVIAKEMGIKPGSAQFHALKNGAKQWPPSSRRTASAAEGEPAKPKKSQGHSGKGPPSGHPHGKDKDHGKGHGNKHK
ncbi:hypothetical protein [Tahibacter amnicola]|uniref:Uncharacterized protein n=1 Tax=Tahibacter amnicola TaxID=2976241 RepID=A0ABY6BGF1_9GAMM|nr:hypothetical protein [Tahibacter amnicola]UXI68383.1 hypothetical protein N4264_01650 [Tahibacter amnicola]